MEEEPSQICRVHTSWPSDAMLSRGLSLLKAILKWRTHQLQFSLSLDSKSWALQSHCVNVCWTYRFPIWGVVLLAVVIEELGYFSHVRVGQRCHSRAFSARTHSADVCHQKCSWFSLKYRISPLAGKSVWSLWKCMNYEYCHGTGGVNISWRILYWLIWN